MWATKRESTTVTTCRGEIDLFFFFLFFCTYGLRLYIFFARSFYISTVSNCRRAFAQNVEPRSPYIDNTPKFCICICIYMYFSFVVLFFMCRFLLYFNFFAPLFLILLWIKPLVREPLTVEHDGHAT